MPQGATPVTLRMQALTAARFDDILAHVTFTGTGTAGRAVCTPCGIRPGPGGFLTLTLTIIKVRVKARVRARAI